MATLGITLPSSEGALKAAPAYGSRKGFVPRSEADFGGGGAFPECLVLQYPLEMGRGTNQLRRTAVMSVTNDGRVQFDSLLTQGGKKAMLTRPVDATAQWFGPGQKVKPSDEDEAVNIVRTKKALEEALDKVNSETQLDRATRSAIVKPEFFRYTPGNQGVGHNSDCQQRMIKMVEKQADPLDPPKFRHKRMPRGPPSPPPAILHSPPKKLTLQDQQEWKVPPCVSSWKNQKGYTIPLDKRLVADGRNLEFSSVNDKFTALSESLYIAERQAREEIRIRREMLTMKKQKEEELREQQLRELAAQARAGRPDSDGRRMASDRKREIERDFRAEKNSKRRRNADRDISEKVVLGQARPTNQEGLFDSRLYQVGGTLKGDGRRDEEDIYDKPLFTDRTAANKIYQHSKERMGESTARPLGPTLFEKDTNQH